MGVAVRVAIWVSVVLLSSTAHGASSRIFGDWKTPDGSVVRTYPCAAAVCMKIVAISSTAPGGVDANNPDPKLRNRPLCNLEIGDQFVLSGETAAAGGRLYDPMSGKTYKGNLDLAGDSLKLRGYVGIPLFGRTETWHRAGEVKTCR